MRLSELMCVKEKMGRFLKFCIVGASAILVNMGLLFFLTEIVGLFYLFSAVLSYVVAILYKFVLCELLVFRDIVRSTEWIGWRVLKFNIASAVTMVIYLVILWFLTGVFNIYYMLSAFIGIVLTTLLRYILSITWVWRQLDKSK